MAAHTPGPVAGARKSYGEYKPVIVHPDGRTEICGQNVRWERIEAQTRFYSGPSERLVYRSGVTFKTREEAIAFAQKDIEFRREAMTRSRVEFTARQAMYGAQAASRTIRAAIARAEGGAE